MSKDLKILDIRNGPLCKSKKIVKKIYNINNVYSSLLSKIYLIDEKK